MATLNIMCVICSEFYEPTDIVHSTGCGHLFHKICLDRWLQTSLTCPQCRQQYRNHLAHRVYLNFSEPTDLDELPDASAHFPEWTSADLTSMPPSNALQSGVDLKGNKVYVGRLPFKEDLLPANFVPEKRCAYVAYNCAGHKFPLNQVEYLVDDGSYSWLKGRNGVVPEHSIVVGYAYTHLGFENLYSGRAQYLGITYPGKVHPSHGVLYLPYDGKEINVSDYEVLVRLPKQSSTPASSNTAEIDAGPQVQANNQQENSQGVNNVDQHLNNS